MSLSDYILSLFPEKQAVTQADQPQSVPESYTPVPSRLNVADQTEPQQQPQASIQAQPKETSFPYDSFIKNASEMKSRKEKLQSAVDRLIMMAPSKDHEERAKYFFEQKLKTIKDMDPSTEGFFKENPTLKKASEDVSQSSTKRIPLIGTANSIINQINYDLANKPKGISEQEHLSNVIERLRAEGKQYSVMLAGTSDALSQGERDSVLPFLDNSIVNFGNMLKAGKSVTPASSMKKNILLYQGQLKALHDTMINRTNSEYNSIARQTSPELADKIVIGAKDLIPYNRQTIIPLVSKENPMGLTQDALMFEAKRRGLIK